MNRIPVCVAVAIIATLARAESLAEEPPPLKVAPDMRVELMSLIFRLAGNPEYGRSQVEIYTRDVEAHFGKFQEHEAVREARRLRRTRGVSYDAVMSMAVHLEDGFSLKERIPLDPRPATLDGRWRPEEARGFLERARRFVEETGFEAFVKEREALFDLTARRLERVLRKEADLAWFESFFGKRSGASFTATFGLLNRGCYGPSIRLPGGVEELYSILSVWRTDGEGKPDFDASVLEVLVHEFTHSYANPIMDSASERLEKPARILFPLVADAMKGQAYGNWRTVMRESLVRACVVRYVQAHKGRAAALKEGRAQAARSFYWVGELAELLDRYESDRKTYPDLHSFLPRIVEFFEGYAPRFAREREDRAAKGPKVVSMTPENGAKDVDPGLTRIIVVFDRPMSNRGWSMVGGGPHFPEITGKPSYDESVRVWTVEVRLKPNWDYEFRLNWGRYDSFRSREGVPLQPVVVRFRTGKAR